MYTCRIRSGKTKIKRRPITNSQKRLIIKSFKNRIAHLKKNINSSTPKNIGIQITFQNTYKISIPKSFDKFNIVEYCLGGFDEPSQTYPIAPPYPKPGSMNLLKHMGVLHDSSDNPDTPKTVAPDLTSI